MMKKEERGLTDLVIVINENCHSRFFTLKNLNLKGGKDGHGKKTGKEEDGRKENNGEEDGKEVRLLPLEP
jgi:hypothetical protein